MTDTDLEAIEKRANNATEGPWRTEQGMVFFARKCTPDENRYGSYAASYGIAVEGSFTPVAGYLPADEARATAYFIASARTDIPVLVAEIRRLKERIAALEGEQ